MKGKLLLIIGIIGFFESFGQNFIRETQNNSIQATTSKIVFYNKSGLAEEQALKLFLEKTFLNPEISQQLLELQYKKESAVGTHLRFKHTYRGLPVFQSFIQANFSKEGVLYSVNNALSEFNTPIKTNPANTSSLWINTQNGFVDGYIQWEWDSTKKYPVNRIYSSDKLPLASFPTRLYFSNPDTIVNAMVYMPNPIVSTNKNYGGMFVDNNDKNTSELTAARVKVPLPMTFQNGKFIFKNKYLRIKDIHNPNIAPSEPKDTFINYTRDQSGFEDANAFYHLTYYSDYLRKIGFSSMLDTILIDTHGENGDDNSFFDPGTYPYILEFGTGNIDDAEDGQVVIHEFGHSLSTIASPGTANGHQRLSMEEGQADYISMAYSQFLNKNKNNLVFSWDGHNEFWDGFVTNTSRKFENLAGILDVDREIWSTALMCIHDKIGKAKTDSLLLSYYYQQSVNTTMPQMAGVILKMDSLLFKGKNVVNIWQCFTDRGILDTVPWYLVKTNSLKKSNEIALNNTNGFSNGLSSAILHLNHPIQWNEIEINNELGQKIKSLSIQEDILLNPENFVSGIYYIRAISKDGYIMNFKLLRL